jgi:hypothetical protein
LLTGVPVSPTAAQGTNTTQIATTEFVTTAVAAATIADATSTIKGKLQLAGDLAGTGSSAASPVISNNAITTSKILDDAVTNAKIGEIISVENGGTGSNMTTTAGYVKQATTGANLSTVSTIPVADVTGAVRSVNGVVPASNGNVAVIIGRVFTGATVDPNLATSIISASPPKQSSDIYIVADGSNPNNGRTFIYDGTNWLEVATDLSTTDARYVNVAGDTMEGDLTIPTGTKIIITDAPTASTHAVNKAYVDNLISSSATPDATASIKGKIKLAGDLGGTADLPTVPGLATKQNLLINPVTGTGTINYLSKFSGTSTLSNSLLFDNGTNIGIGTTAPGARFHIEGATTGNSGASGSGSLMWLKQTTTWGLAAPYALWVDGYSYLNGFRISGTDGQRAIYNQMANIELGFGTNGGDITFSSNNGLTRRVYILNSNGNMGIGTATPSSKLEISTGSAGSSGLRFTNLTNTTNGTAAFSGILGVNSSGDVGIGTIAGSTLSGLTSGQVTFGGMTGNLAQSSNFFWDQTNNRLGIGTNNPTTNLDLVGGFNLRNTIGSGGSNYGIEFNTNSNAPRIDWVFNGGYVGQFSSDANNFVLHNSKLSTGGFRFTTNPGTGTLDRLNILNNGNVGIGTSTPVTNLQINNPLAATASVNANAQVLRLSRPDTSGLKWNNIAQFNLGSYSTAIAATSRLDLALTNGLDASTLTNVMTWQANGNVGINNTAPSAPLVVQGTTGTGVLKLIAPSVASGDNWWLGFGHGTTSTDANDRARIGAEVVSGGAGRLFFTTGLSGAQTRAMFIDESQRVGIGTSTPTSRLVVRGLNNPVSALGTAQTNAIFRVEGESNHSLDMGTFTASPYGSYVQSHNKAAPISLPLSINPVGGNVGIGTSNPTSTLEVNGSATNTAAYNSGSATAILFNNSNLAYTSASPTAFFLQGIKNGGTYTLAVQGTTSGTASFTAAGFTFKSINNGTTIAGKDTLYTFVVMGTTVYVYMAAGFN